MKRHLHFLKIKLKTKARSIFFSVLGLVIIGAGLGTAFVYGEHKVAAPDINAQTTPIIATSSDPQQTNAEPTTSAKEGIAKSPPKYSPSSSQATITKSDGSKTTVVSDGNIDSSEIERIAAIDVSSSNPAAVPFLDRTGQYAAMESILKTYLTDTLRWTDEISALHQIILEDAGNTGWAGQYTGSYDMAPNGDIVSSFGFITLNVYYYKSSPYLTDYLKLILSHEYGHHYTLYHKWVDMDLGVGTRFPNSYYQVRPLPVSGTTADCSVSWNTCDAEIIAEDYSYLYSGYGYHAMASTFGYPSAGTKTWLNNLGIDSSPSLSISAPAEGSAVSGGFEFLVAASDDRAVAKVEFFVDNILVATSTSSPYRQTISSTGYENGNHVLKAIAYDSGGKTAQQQINIIFSNATVDTIKPTVTITAPANGTNWSAGDLLVSATGADNVAVSKIEIYINDYLAASENAASISRLWQYFGGGFGQYTIRARVWDTSNNFEDATVTINKIK